MEPPRGTSLGARPELWLPEAGTVWVPVRGTSMVPTLVEGDRVEVRRASREELLPGDLLAFPRSGELIVHRLLRLHGERFLEMGDGQGRGNWQPWPEALGRVLCAESSGGGRRDLAGARAETAVLARRLLRRHRANTLAEHLPGTLLRRVFLRLLRPLIY